LKNQLALKLVFLSLVLSSCGLIGDSNSPQQTSESTQEAAATDDLFAQTMEETGATAQNDSPANDELDDLKSLESDFSPVAPNEAPTVAETPQIQEEAPVLVEESIPEIKNEVMPPAFSDSGEVKTYKVQKGETLMQIAFKIYGDISRWKDIKAMNSEKLTNNSSLMANTTLKYRAPQTPFVWNPNGTPYMIKNGETLGTISNTVYSTPKKWKNIWENNKPLIKNPNVIYAGFTLYYPGANMANFVQPEEIQTEKPAVKAAVALPVQAPEKMIEELIAEEEIKANQMAEKEIAQTEPEIAEEQDEDYFVDSMEDQLNRKPSASNTTAKEAATLKPEQQAMVDEATQSLSAPQRSSANEIDLINNVSAPLQSDVPVQAEEEIAPDIDEELQVLN
jgi:nucleoid-associated protein YgaU